MRSGRKTQRGLVIRPASATGSSVGTKTRSASVGVRFVAFLAFASCVSLPAATQSIGAWTVRDPLAMALGGSFLAVSPGQGAFFGNPAWFAETEGFWLLSGCWAYAPPTAESLAAFATLLSGAEGTASTDAISSLAAQGAFGAGSQAGVVLLSKGVAFGLVASVDTWVDPSGSGGSYGRQDWSGQVIVGYGARVELFGLYVAVGGDLRVSYRATGEIGAGTLADAVSGATSFQDALFASTVLAGFGMALDFGVSVPLGEVEIALAVRDISAPFPMKSCLLSDVAAGLATGNPPTGSSGDPAMPVPLVVAGLAWRPVVDPGFEPVLAIELSDPIGAIAGTTSLLSMLRIGAYARFFGLFWIGAGLSGGAPSFGAGLDLSFLSVDFAVFSERLGATLDAPTRYGAALEISIKF